MKNSIEEDIKDIEKYISFTSKRENFSHDTDWNWNKDLANKIEHILSDYKRVLEINEVLLKENEELKKNYINVQNNTNMTFHKVVPPPEPQLPTKTLCESFSKKVRNK